METLSLGGLKNPQCTVAGCNLNLKVQEVVPVRVEDAEDVGAECLPVSGREHLPE